MFVNACRHRGVELCRGPSGRDRRLVCPFHAWTYDTTGRLHHVPDDEVESSWKLMYDTFLEFYHGVYAHKATLAHLLERNLVHFDPVGRHWRMAAAKKSLATLADTPEEDWDVLAHAVVSYDIFPNLAINLHGDHAAVYRIVPHATDPGRCRWHFALLTPEPVTSDKGRRYFDKNFDYIVSTGREDVAMAESTQRTLASGANDALVYSRFEPVLTWFHQRVAVLFGG